MQRSYSPEFDKFYIGYTSDIHKRLIKHNTSKFNSFTSKFRPWKVYVLFDVGKNKAEALKLEKFIKQQKSKKLLLNLGDKNFKPTGKLAQLVRVPYLRD